MKEITAKSSLNDQIERTSIMVAVVIVLLLMMSTVSAYSVPTEFKGKAMSDSELYTLATDHNNEPWARYIINDMIYRYNARNHAQFLQRIHYQATQPKLTRNNLVRDH